MQCEPAAGEDGLGVDPDLGEPGPAMVGEDVVAVAVGTHDAVAEQALPQLDAAAAGQVVVARARLGDRLLRLLLAQRADLDGRGYPGERLQRGGDVGPRQRVVAMPALRLRADEAGIDQPV